MVHRHLQNSDKETPQKSHRKSDVSLLSTISVMLKDSLVQLLISLGQLWRGGVCGS